MWFLIGVSELERYLDEGKDLYLVDLRDRASFRRGHIRGAVNIPAEELWEQEAAGWEAAEQRRRLPKDRLIVLCCYHGPQSMRAARMLARDGYEVADVYGGMQAYRAYRGKYLV